ncbi:precorrin-3B synthase [Actinoplanes nipponensis]|uniref:precorrin-3B synthase n=1 Tax=Actinoplanes nipponensis TaxID=135950 RepID=UPI001EF3CCEB|nr:precorrin-3B synthase [Actinoplanes nipponensis]
MPIPSVRADADACPGALRLHAAADGPLARVRVPGGRLTGAQLGTLRALAARWGDGCAELTSRANLQLRGLREAPVAELAARLRAAGLLPSETHELVRNIAASPLAGGLPLEALDRALCADPSLAELPGRFLFALDGGAGDVAFGADVAALPRGGETAIIFAGVDAGVRVPAAEVVQALLAAAHAFLAERAAQLASPAPGAPVPPSAPAAAAFPVTDPDRPAAEHTGVAPSSAGVTHPRNDSAAGGRRVAWRVRELTDGAARVAARTAAALGRTPGEAVRLPRPGVREPIGIIEQPDGTVAVGALVPLGRLSAVQLKVLEAAESVIVTPWRGVVLPGLSPQTAAAWATALAGAGLEVDPGSRWAGVTACAGRPGCAKSLADVRADADAATVAGEGLPVHWVGCARGCGSPAGPHVRVEATGTGYEVRSPCAGGAAAIGEVGALVGAARKG